VVASVLKNSGGSRLRLLSSGASGIVVLAGAMVFCGWLFGAPALIRLIPTNLALNPLAALCFVLAGLSLLVRTSGYAALGGRIDRWAKAAAFLVAALGAIKVADYMLGLGFHVDQLLFPNKLSRPDIYPHSEMAPNTALNFLLCGTALLLFDSKFRSGLRPAQTLVLAEGLIALLALIGYGYRVLMLYGLGAGIPMSLASAILFTLFALAFLAARPDRGFMSLITSQTIGGAVARRLLPMAVLIPCVLGGLLLLGEQRGYYDREFAISIFAVASMIIFSGLIWWNARLLHLADLERVRTERRLAAQHNSTRVLAESVGLADALPRLLQVVCEALGWQVGAIWTVESSSNTVRCTALWHLPSTDSAEFVGVTRSGAFPKGVGLPGRVWASLGPFWIPDLDREVNLPRAPQAARAGLHGAFGFPIWVGQELFGIMEFFSREIERPDEALIEMLANVGTQTGLLIERTRAQEQLSRTSANLQRSNTELQQFAYVASHDLFEPLRMITSYLQLLSQRCAGKLDEQGTEFIAYAIDGAKRMDALIRDLLAYSRVEVSHTSLTPTDLDRVFNAAVANLKVAIEESGAVITHDPLPLVRADVVQLTQVFQNLVGNAIKFRGSAAPRINVTAQRSNAEWLFAVRDNGIGIEPKNFERIFVIFQRLHTRDEYAGTGMGLAICKKIIERHGGRIWVESTPGRGSTFFFTLPATGESPNLDQAP
jgi:signal transduction histidine kinase